WRFTDFLPRSAEYGRAHSDPRQGWWVSAKSARRELRPSPSTIRSAVAVVPIGARSMDRVGGPDLGSAVLLAQQSHRHKSAPRPAVDTAECSARTAPAYPARS